MDGAIPATSINMIAVKSMDSREYEMGKMDAVASLNSTNLGNVSAVLHPGRNYCVFYCQEYKRATSA